VYDERERSTLFGFILEERDRKREKGGERRENEK